jgi:hypothetical protein
MAKTMVHHPSGITMDILGIESSTKGTNGEEHDASGEVLDLDVIVRFRRVQVQIV